jgi:transposase
MLARMGAALELEGQDAPGENLFDLKELMAARRALIKDRAAAKTCLCAVTLPLVKRQLTARPALARLLAAVEAAPSTR